MKYIEGSLPPRKQLAAHLLVDNDFSASLDGERRTLDEIAAEVGVSRQSLHAWRKEPEFIAAMQSVSDSRLAQYRSQVDAMLLKLVAGTGNNRIGSVKAIELYYKKQNLLVNRTEVTTHNSSQQLSQEQVDAGIDALSAKLKADSVEVIRVKDVE